MNFENDDIMSSLKKLDDREDEIRRLNGIIADQRREIERLENEYSELRDKAEADPLESARNEVLNVAEIAAEMERKAKEAVELISEAHAKLWRLKYGK